MRLPKSDLGRDHQWLDPIAQGREAGRDTMLHRVAAGFAALRDWIEPLVISSEVGFRKPHPRFYEAACARLGLPADRVLCVGDDLRNDVIGPREAGLHAVLIARDSETEHDVPSLNGLDSLIMMLMGENSAKKDPHGRDRDWNSRASRADKA